MLPIWICMASLAATSPDAWLEQVRAARDAVRVEAVDAAFRVRALEGREVLVASVAVRVEDPVLDLLADGLARGVDGSRAQALRHLANYEREASALLRASPLPPTHTLGGGIVTQSALPEGGSQLQHRLQQLRERIRTLGHGLLRERPVLGFIAAGGVTFLLVLAFVFQVRRRQNWSAVEPLEHPVPSLPGQRLSGGPREALRGAFLDLLQILESEGLVQTVVQRTNGQVARALHGTMARDFRSASAVYERIWYGGGNARSDDWETMDRALDTARGGGGS